VQHAFTTIMFMMIPRKQYIFRYSHQE